MTDSVRFIDRSGAATPPPDFWPSVVVKKRQIDDEIARLAAAPAPANGVRRSLVLHPRADKLGPGFAPGITVAIEVLNPGERTTVSRTNATFVQFCLRGSGTAIVNGKHLAYAQYGTFNVPGMATVEHVNDGPDVQVRLTYSNQALLEKMRIHVVEDNVATPAATGPSDERTSDERAFSAFPLTDDGAYLMPYEQLINPDVKASPALVWPWERVKAELDKLVALGTKYRGRRLFLLYNPATENTNGTSKAFFATLALLPPNTVDVPHRHTAVAINYYFAGSGHSKVNGQRVDWEAGDLQLSAPGWAVHNHASHDEPVYALTIQDSPLNIAMESMMWQENLRQPAAALGTQTGFSTNRAELVEV